MVIIRLVSLIFVALALMVLGADLLFWLESETFEPRSFIGLWHTINADSAASAQAWVNGLPDFASLALNGILSAWAFVVLGIPGVGLAILGSRR